MAFLEIAAKPFGARGFISSVRPKRYYMISRDSLDRIFGELHDLLNFFVLEFQRVLFAENIFATVVVRNLFLISECWVSFLTCLFLVLGILRFVHWIFPYQVHSVLGFVTS